MSTNSLLQRILQEHDRMGPAEQRLGDFVKAHPGQVIHMSMARLSQECDVSDPTVMRFCRRFGFEGYQDFKLNLAQSLVPSAPFAYEQIVPGDSIENIVRKTARNSLNAIQRALEDLLPAQIEEGAKLLVQYALVKNTDEAKALLGTADSYCLKVVGVDEYLTNETLPLYPCQFQFQSISLLLSLLQY